MARTLVRRPHPTTSFEALPASYWSQMRRVCSPDRPDVPIDHVVAGPSGIWVIRYLPALDGAGGAPGDGLPGGRSADAWGGYADVVASLLPPRYGDRGRPVVCLRGGGERAEEVGGVLVASLGALEHIVRSSPTVLSTSEVGQAYAFLRATLVDIPPEVDTSGRRLRAVVRVVAASVAVAAASVGVLLLGPDALELFTARG